MAYALHIQRPDALITLEEWEAAVNATEGVRLTEEEHIAQDPATGVQISIAAAPGDAEIFFPQDGGWYPAILWREQRGTGTVTIRGIRGLFKFGAKSYPGWQVLASLARTLGAQIQGDDGEVYDLD